jgi:predicted nucleic acid-binding protein
VILVDTSVWIDHLRGSEPQLTAALELVEVAVHPLVISELACGNLINRAEIIALLGNLPRLPEATHAEALTFIDRNQLMGRGVGYVDIHLLASAALGGDVYLWTKDKRLRVVAQELGLVKADLGH